MHARSTADISLQTLHAVGAELGADFQLEVDESQIFLRSAEPPSWVTFLAEAVQSIVAMPNSLGLAWCAAIWFVIYWFLAKGLDHLMFVLSQSQRSKHAA